MISKIKTRYLWISIAVCLLAAIGLIIGVTHLEAPWTTVVIVLLAIIFIYMTVAIQVVSKCVTPIINPIAAKRHTAILIHKYLVLILLII